MLDNCIYACGRQRTEVPLEAFRGEHRMVDAHGKQTACDAQVSLIEVQLVLSLGVLKQLSEVTQKVLLRTHGIKDPRDIFFSDDKYPFANFSERVQLRQGVDRLIQTTGEPSEDDHVELRAGRLYGTRGGEIEWMVYTSLPSAFSFSERALMHFMRSDES